MGFPDKSRSHAVLIGAAAFDDRSLSPLPAVARNLSTLRALLTDPDHGSFSRDRCTPFLDPTYSTNVSMALTRIVRLVEDVLLVYYAGHGVIGEHGGQLHLALHDTGMQDPDSTSLPFRRLKEVLNTSPAATKVLILDCCYSGLAVANTQTSAGSAVLARVAISGTCTLTATAEHQEAIAPPGDRYTAFTGELISILRDGVPGGPADLDLNTIYHQLVERLARRGLPTPLRTITDTSNLLVLGKNRARKDIPSFPQPRPSVPTPPRDRLPIIQPRPLAPTPPRDRLPKTEPRPPAPPEPRRRPVVKVPPPKLDVAPPPTTRSVGRRTFLLGGTSAAALGTAGYFILKSDPREPLAASGRRAAWSTKAGSGVVVDGSRVFLGAATGKVVALDSGSGAQLWTGSAGTPRSVDSTTVHCAGEHGITLLNVDTGTSVAHFASPVSTNGSFIVTADSVYVTRQTNRMAVEAFDLATKTMRWNATIDTWYTRPYDAGPVILFPTEYGAVFALDKATGRNVWNTSVDPSRVAAKQIRGTSDLVISDGIVLYGDGWGKVWALRLTDGSALWAHQVSETGAPRPTATADAVIFSNVSEEGKLVAVDKATGSPVWTFSTQGLPYAALELADGKVFVVTDQGHLHCVQESTGNEKWRLDLGAGAKSNPHLGSRQVFVTTDAGYVYAVDQNSGKPNWRSPVRITEEASVPIHVSGDTAVFDDGSKLYAVR